jgi:hypothetical protein
MQLQYAGRMPMPGRRSTERGAGRGWWVYFAAVAVVCPACAIKQRPAPANVESQDRVPTGVPVTSPAPAGETVTPAPTPAGGAARRDGFPPPDPRRVAYVSGVVIDWDRRVVEVEAEVVLRRGPLELLACSPNTREHESILVVGARPKHIYEAMGLLGLRPGSPVRYDEAQDRWVPATGERLRLSVRVGDAAGEGETIPVEEWMWDVAGERPVGSIEWVFAGSTGYGKERFGADVEGTIVCVVDFGSALIAPGSLHTADNEELWLAARTDRIPPVATRCRLVIGSAEAPPGANAK